MAIGGARASATGATALGAFDRALPQVPVYEVNPIPLRSVPPVGTTVVRVIGDPAEFCSGAHLLRSFALNASSNPGVRPWSGFGWVFISAGGGLLVGTHERSTRQGRVRSRRDSCAAEPRSDWLHVERTRVRGRRSCLSAIACLCAHDRRTPDFVAVLLSNQVPDL
jgi:pyruvoyl-dependent arginine decarboxylase (PvlArgDC)